jgi:hypothetical protein
VGKEYEEITERNKCMEGIKERTEGREGTVLT